MERYRLGLMIDLFTRAAMLQVDYDEKGENVGLRNGTSSSLMYSQVEIIASSCENFKDSVKVNLLVEGNYVPLFEIFVFYEKNR